MIETAWLYEPLLSGERLVVTKVIAGGVASYWNDGDTAVELVLPALSVQVPETVAEAESGPPYVGAEQNAMPEVASVPENWNVTPRLYQPPLSGPCVAAAPLTEGGVASRLIVTPMVVDTFDVFVTVQVNVVPVVSDAIVLVSQPFVDKIPLGSDHRRRR